jgi:hypothetical protein
MAESEDIEYDYSSEEREDDYTADEDDDAMDWNVVVAAAATSDNPNAAPMSFKGTRKHDPRCVRKSET